MNFDPSYRRRHRAIGLLGLTEPAYERPTMTLQEYLFAQIIAKIENPTDSDIKEAKEKAFFIKNKYIDTQITYGYGEPESMK